MTVGQSPSELTDNSTYSKFLAIYTRNDEFQLLSARPKCGFDLNTYWAELSNHIKLDLSRTYGESITYRSVTMPVHILSEGFIPVRWAHCDNVVAMEYTKQGETQVRGIVVGGYEADHPRLVDFHNFFCNLILTDSRVHFSMQPAVYDSDLSKANQVTDFFAAYLKNTKDNGDKWELGGREHFLEKLAFFTKRNLKIEAVLPAFPCKSSNTEKVHVQHPDRGEELALRRLIDFAREVKKFYPPGFKSFIVSDGHVFSDCIGVDDDAVDTYTDELKYLYSTVSKTEGVENDDLVGFISLKDMLFNSDGTYAPGLVDEITLDHYTGTTICEDSEISRKMMIAGCDTDAGELRQHLGIEGHARLKLYRGFWKFMSEDLRLNSHCKTLSKNKFKKTVSAVAFEMIKRNDAYSNLVELMLPFHMRLSIHAHDNAGPKFGILLISPQHCKVITSLESQEEPKFHDKLHIPTPWHNSIVYIEGHQQFYMTKSKVVTDAIMQGYYTGDWVESVLANGFGGHFVISPKKPEAM